MCGIVGGNISSEIVKKMQDRLAHRGPDAEGDFSDGRFALGHRRLAILDLHERANQPMTHGDWVIAYNGEIYNFLEIKNELERLGEHFTTESDTEVLLKAFGQWGTNTLARLNGDFAFCVYDKKNLKAYLCRDRLGNKPLYYFWNGREFVFASEIQALLPFSKLDFNEQSLGDALLFSINDHETQTIFQNVKNVRPGNYIEFDVKTGVLTETHYWQLKSRSPCEEFDDAQFESNLDEFDALLTDAVKLRLNADVPVGCLLSGGVDSSLIAALVAKLQDKVTFFHATSPKYPAVDESAFAAKVARHLKIPLQTLSLHDDDILRDFGDVVRTQGDIFRSASIYMQFAIMRAVAGGVKVILSGQGADELFGGYGHHAARFLMRFPAEERARVGLYGEAWVSKEKLQGEKFYLSGDEKLAAFKKENDAGFNLVRKILPDFEPRWQLLVDKFGADLQKSLALETTALNLPQLLRYEDRNAMRFSVENRTPFTDYRVIEFAHNLPLCYKFRRGFSKFFLRALALRYVPAEIAWRLDKKGFSAPEEAWGKALGVSPSEGLVGFRIKIFNELTKGLHA